MGMSEEAFDRVIETNLKGTFNCIRFAARPMIRQKSGCIINMASVVGVAGNAGQANYAASKAGVIGLTKTAARELASRGIRVNAIAPGFIETDMTEVLSDKVKEASVSQIPLGHFGKPEDVANLAAFLASEAAAYITGQVIHCDGGMGIEEKESWNEEKSSHHRAGCGNPDWKYRGGILERRPQGNLRNRNDYEI